MIFLVHVADMKTWDKKYFSLSLKYYIYFIILDFIILNFFFHNLVIFLVKFTIGKQAQKAKVIC